MYHSLDDFLRKLCPGGIYQDGHDWPSTSMEIIRDVHLLASLGYAFKGDDLGFFGFGLAYLITTPINDLLNREMKKQPYVP